MAVTVPVPLTTEEEAALLAQAKTQGVSVDSLLRQAVRRIISAARRSTRSNSARNNGRKSSGSGSIASQASRHHQTKRSAGRASTLAKTSGGKCSAFSIRTSSSGAWTVTIRCAVLFGARLLRFGERKAGYVATQNLIEFLLLQHGPWTPTDRG
jgi:hypothetical protein